MPESSGRAGLAALQRQVQAAVIDGDSPDSQSVVADNLVRSSAGLGSAERLAIYQRGYLARLVECLRAMHPALRHALGDDLFDRFARDYLASNPSRRYTLCDLDAGLAGHLDATRPREDGEGWPELIVDLARLERAFNEVYDGPGTEGERVLDAADLGPEPDRRWLGAVLEPVPCLRLLSSRYPVGDYLAAVRRGDSPPLPRPAPTFLALCRRDWVVTFTALDRGGFRALRALVAGTIVGDALVGRAQGWSWVQDWADRGFFRAAPDKPDSDTISAKEDQ